MKSLTILPNATVILVFGSSEERNALRERLAATLPREVHSRIRANTSSEGETLSLRIQDINHPVHIALDGGEAPAADAANIATGTPSFERLKGIPRENVPGANAEAHTEERETTSGFNLTQGVPGAVNNDPSTATNAAYEGSPAQAMQSAMGEGLGANLAPTPGGFAGPDKAAHIKAPAPQVLPEGEEQNSGAVNVSRAAEQEAAEGEEARRQDSASAGFTGGAQDARRSDDVNATKAEIPAAGESKAAAPAGETADDLEANNTKEQLTALAEKEGVEFKAADTKAVIAAAIVAKRNGAK